MFTVGFSKSGCTLESHSHSQTNKLIGVWSLAGDYFYVVPHWWSMSTQSKIDCFEFLRESFVDEGMKESAVRALVEEL